MDAPARPLSDPEEPGIMSPAVRALACALLFLAAPLAAAGPREPVAILYRVSGEALWIAPGHAPKPLLLFDRLPAGATVELKAGSRLALAFVTGKRYGLVGPARATLGRGNLAARSGGVRALPSVPPLPRLEPIAESEHPGAGAAAVRIRGEEIEGLYPGHGARALAEETVLQFQPVPGASRYRIEVQDNQGDIIFQTDTESSSLRVPAGRLRAGHRYGWMVRTLDLPGAVAQGQSELVTLCKDAVQSHRATRATLVAEGPESLPLLAAIDRGLGLLRESREDLRAALGDDPENPALREALAAIERRLKEEQDD
jgi:hypothetical protein